ncbi:MAG: GNAT family N-acetyltransferase [Anaerolineae bacterium]|jgi:RimJ/RimL family protein N-acetyltransferase|nr:GNAT family N-acetyltransferase [Anaerolineae bacterium]
MPLTLRPMTEADARTILRWQYPGPYDYYNPDPAGLVDDLAQFTAPEGGYTALYDGNELVGHVVIGQEARVPGFDYDDSVLDVGAGIRPDLTGLGQGAARISQALVLLRDRYAPSAFRATIAAWNTRAQAAVRHNGFIETARFTNPKGVLFIVFECCLNPNDHA